MQQKLIQHLMALTTRTKLTGLQPITPGVDVAYEAGRRIGVVQGMELMVSHAIEFFAEKEKGDKDL